MNDLKWSVQLCFVSTSSTVFKHVRSYCGELNVNLVLLSLVHLYLCHLFLSINGLLFVTIQWLCVEFVIFVFSYKLCTHGNNIYLV